MNREWMIQKLIESQVDYITQHGCGLWLYNILERGFMGFGNMSDEQLLREMRERGLFDEFGKNPWSIDDQNVEPEPEDDEIRRMIGERVTDNTWVS